MGFFNQITARNAGPSPNQAVLPPQVTTWSGALQNQIGDIGEVEMTEEIQPLSAPDPGASRREANVEIRDPSPLDLIPDLGIPSEQNRMSKEPSIEMVTPSTMEQAQADTNPLQRIEPISPAPSNQDAREQASSSELSSFPERKDIREEVSLQPPALSIPPVLESDLKKEKSGKGQEKGKGDQASKEMVRELTEVIRELKPTPISEKPQSEIASEPVPIRPNSRPIPPPKKAGTRSKGPRLTIGKITVEIAGAQSPKPPATPPVRRRNPGTFTKGGSSRSNNNRFGLGQI